MSGHYTEHFRKTGVSEKNNFNDDDDAVFIARRDIGAIMMIIILISWDLFIVIFVISIPSEQFSV